MATDKTLTPGRFYILDRDGAILAGPYSRREDAEKDAEWRYRAMGEYAFVGTLDEWNAHRRFVVA